MQKIQSRNRAQFLTPIMLTRVNSLRVHPARSVVYVRAPLALLRTLLHFNHVLLQPAVAEQLFSSSRELT